MVQFSTCFSFVGLIENLRKACQGVRVEILVMSFHKTTMHTRVCVFKEAKTLAAASSQPSLLLVMQLERSSHSLGNGFSYRFCPIGLFTWRPLKSCRSRGNNPHAEARCLLPVQKMRTGFVLSKMYTMLEANKSAPKWSTRVC